MVLFQISVPSASVCGGWLYLSLFHEEIHYLGVYAKLALEGVLLLLLEGYLSQTRSQ